MDRYSSHKKLCHQRNPSLGSCHLVKSKSSNFKSSQPNSQEKPQPVATKKLINFYKEFRDTETDSMEQSAKINSLVCSGQIEQNSFWKQIEKFEAYYSKNVNEKEEVMPGMESAEQEQAFVKDSLSTGQQPSHRENL